MQWQERFEKESSDNTIKTGMLNQTKAELRDQLLAAKNAEIMQDQLQKQVDALTKQNSTMLDQVNKATAQSEQLTRSLQT